MIAVVRLCRFYRNGIRRDPVTWKEVEMSFHVVGFGQYSLNSPVVMMSDVMHFMYESYLHSPYATCVWPGELF